MKNYLDPVATRTVTACNYNKFSYAVHADRVMAPHCLFYMLEGEWEIWQDETPFTVKKDDVFFLTSRHRCFGTKKSSAIVRTCFVWPSAAADDRLIDDPSEPYTMPAPPPYLIAPLIHCQSNPFVKDLFARTVQLYYSDDVYKDEEVKATLVLLFAELSKMSVPEGNYPQIVKDVIDLINRTPHKFFTLQELASGVYVSPKTLSTQFKNATGKTLHEYQTDLKMKMAGSLLNSSPNITLKELAKHFGYYDEFHFSRVYKQHFGRTPKSKKF